MSPGIGSGPRQRGRAPGPPRDRVKARLLRLYSALQRRFGPQQWWPGRSPFEIAVGAVLTQHTAWINAAHAIGALRARGLLAPTRLAALDVGSLSRVIRPAGTPRVKSRRLLALTRWDFGPGARDGRRDSPLCSGSAGVRRRRLRPAGSGPASADRSARRIRGSPPLARGAPAVRPGSLQRVSRAARGGRQVELSFAAAVRGLRAALRPARSSVRSLTIRQETIIGRTRSAPRRSARRRRVFRSCARARPFA